MDHTEQISLKTHKKIHPGDLVAVALMPLTAGTALREDGKDIVLREDIPQGHKFALTDIPAGAPVIKYGAAIGTAARDIPVGAWVHTHNLKTSLGDMLNYAYTPARPRVEPVQERSFEGYVRPDGSVSVRNEIWIIPTVGCVNSIAQAIERRAQALCTGSVESIAAFPHPYGCSQMGDDQENTRKILAGLVNHPNAGGVLVLGLGCENSNIDVLKPYIGEIDPRRVKFLVCQESDDEIADGLALVEELARYAGGFHRQPVSAAKLIVGMKCGGSDGLSGITANPTVGAFSDWLVSQGGTTILTEVPEMFGAETILMNRCANEHVFADTVALVNDFKRYFQRHGQTIYENPSPGNKKGGISTLEDKSLGCIQKSGSAPVSGVLAYGERVKTRGLNLLSAPGNDLVASTALAAAGAHIVLFTTGRGTPFASPVPTVKVSSNTALAQKKSGWIDFDCGPLAEDTEMEELHAAFCKYVLDVASGRRVKSELSGFHDMAIFKQGVTL